MSLTDVFGFFCTALTMFLSSTAVVFLYRTVRCLLLSTPAVSFFLRTFQVTSYPHLFSSFKMACFSPRLLSGLYVGLAFLTQMQSSQAKSKSRLSELFV